MAGILLFSLMITFGFQADSQTVSASKNTVLTFDQAWQAANDACAGFKWTVENRSKADHSMTLTTEKGVTLVIELIEGDGVVTVKASCSSHKTTRKEMQAVIDRFFSAFVESL